MSSLKLSSPGETCPFHPPVHAMLIESTRSAPRSLLAVIGGVSSFIGPIVRRRLSAFRLGKLKETPCLQTRKRPSRFGRQVVGALALIGGR